MYDDNAGNIYCKYLEDIIARQDEIIDGLKSAKGQGCDIGADARDIIDQQIIEIDELCERIQILETHSNYLRYLARVEKEAFETTILATQIQAAESEHRADEEKRARIMLKMRL